MEQNPFDPLIDQISELISLADENKTEAIKGRVNPDLLDQLDLLEFEVEFFRRVTDQAFRKSGISEDDLKKQVRQSVSDPNSKDEKLLARASLLKDQLQSLERHYAIRAQAAKMQKKQKNDSVKKRKKKFKKLGGQGWIPL